MKKFRYVFCNGVLGTDGLWYDIEIPSPILRDTEKEAEEDGETNNAFRFALKDGEIKLLCFESEDLTTTKVNGDVVSEYTWEEFKKLGGKLRQLKEDRQDKVIIDPDDFKNTDKTFKDIFPHAEENKLYYVDGEAYFVDEVECA